MDGRSGINEFQLSLATNCRDNGVNPCQLEAKVAQVVVVNLEDLPASGCQSCIALVTLSRRGFNGMKETNTDVSREDYELMRCLCCNHICDVLGKPICPCDSDLNHFRYRDEVDSETEKTAIYIASRPPSVSKKQSRPLIAWTIVTQPTQDHC